MTMDKNQLEKLFDDLFPITRSISGNGLRKSLSIIGKIIPIDIIEYPTGTKCFDWTVPDEWNIKGAYIKRTSGETILDFKNCNLHVMGYSMPFKGRVSLAELRKHLHFIEHKPDAIPFATSYYKREWGLCLPYSTYAAMEDEEYDVMIDSSLEPGNISVGECFIKGRSKKEIILFSHIGHPSMANDQLSGPITVTAVAKWLLENRKTLKYSYRILLAPETIGSIAYISQNKSRLKRKTAGGYTVVCTADAHSFTYRFSRHSDSISDRAMVNALQNCEENYELESFSPLGCDERHFNSHGIGVPMGSIMRSSPGSYPEYHTSLDNKTFICFDKMASSVELIKSAIMNIEANAKAVAIHKNCEPKLDKYGLYPTLSDKNKNNTEPRTLVSLWALADGSSLLEIAEQMDMPVYALRKYADTLVSHGLIKLKEL